MANGGKRPGAGRPAGSLSKKTIEKKMVEEALHQRILAAVDRVFNAQLALAEGVSHLFKIVKTGKGANQRVEHVLVTDQEEIKQFLDEHEGSAGTLDGSEDYYYIQTKSPDNKAIDSMLDRAFGKPTSRTEVTGEGGGPLSVNVISYAGHPAAQLPTEAIPTTPASSD